MYGSVRKLADVTALGLFKPGIFPVVEQQIPMRVCGIPDIVIVRFGLLLFLLFITGLGVFVLDRQRVIPVAQHFVIKRLFCGLPALGKFAGIQCSVRTNVFK